MLVAGRRLRHLRRWLRGATAKKLGELCFNTAMSGYQEILSDPSYADQIISFTCPHIGNVGCNDEDMESGRSFACGAVVREPVGAQSNHRATASLSGWLAEQGVPGISCVDTRTLTRRIRDRGALRAVLAHKADGAKDFDLPALLEEVRGWSGVGRGGFGGAGFLPRAVCLARKRLGERWCA